MDHPLDNKYMSTLRMALLGESKLMMGYDPTCRILSPSHRLSPSPFPLTRPDIQICLLWGFIVIWLCSWIFCLCLDVYGGFCNLKQVFKARFSRSQVFDGHNGKATAIFTRENLLNHVLSALPSGLSRDEWLHALPRPLVSGFVKTDKEFQSRGETSGTRVTFVIVDGWTVTVACVGDSRCILDTQGGSISNLTVDHRLEDNTEERERVTASGGEVGRLSIVGGSPLSYPFLFQGGDFTNGNSILQTSYRL